MTSPVPKSPAALAAAAVGIRPLGAPGLPGERARAVVASVVADGGVGLSVSTPEAAGEILEASNVAWLEARFRRADSEMRAAAAVRLMAEVRLGELAPPVVGRPAKAEETADASAVLFPGVPWATRGVVQEWRKAADVGREALRAYLSTCEDVPTRRGFFGFARPKPPAEPPPPPAPRTGDPEPLPPPEPKRPASVRAPKAALGPPTLTARALRVLDDARSGLTSLVMEDAGASTSEDDQGKALPSSFGRLMAEATPHFKRAHQLVSEAATAELEDHATATGPRRARGNA